MTDDRKTTATESGTVKAVRAEMSDAEQSVYRYQSEPVRGITAMQSGHVEPTKILNLLAHTSFAIR